MGEVVGRVAPQLPKGSVIKVGGVRHSDTPRGGEGRGLRALGPLWRAVQWPKLATCGCRTWPEFWLSLEA